MRTLRTAGGRAAIMVSGLAAWIKERERSRSHRLAALGLLALSCVALAASPVSAQGRLPIAEGVWVESRSECNVAESVTVYSDNRFGVYIGPMGSLEPITTIVRAPGGWTQINAFGGLQIKLQQNGQAVFRALNASGSHETWRQTLRQCPLEQLSPQMRAAVGPYFDPARPRAPSPTSTALPAGMAASRWQVMSGSAGMPHAQSPPASGSGVRLNLTCAGGFPMAIVSIAGRTDRYAAMDAVTSEGTGGVTLEHDRRAGAYTGSIQYGEMVRFLAGNASYADLKIDGRPAGRLSLAGSTQAIRTALASCWQPTAPEVATAAGAPVGPLGIAPGHYVDEGTPCEEAYDTFFYDGARVGRANLGGNGALRIWPLGRVTRQRGGTMLIVDRDIELRRLANGRIELTIQDTGPPMRLCDASRMPRTLRANTGRR